MLDLQVPQVRGCQPYHPSVYTKWQRSERALLPVVYASWDRVERLRREGKMAERSKSRCAAVSSMLSEGLEDKLAVLSFPEHHHRKLASTNIVESVMKRLKKRTRVVGIFPNRASCDRLIGAQLLELHERWQVEEKSYMNTECVN